MSAALRAELEHDPARLVEDAADLLSRPPYREEVDGPLAVLGRTVREWGAEVLDQLLRLFTGEVTWAWAVVLAGVVLLLLVTWRATRGLSLDRAVEAPAGGGEERRPAGAWSADADAHGAAGRWDEAVRCRYLALVGGLVEEGVIEEWPGWTVGELDQQIAEAAPRLAPDVRRAGALFAAVVYGRQPAQSEQAREMADLAARVREAGQRRSTLAEAGV